MKQTGIVTSGAGRKIAEAAKPAVLDLRTEAKVLIFAFSSPTSGIPLSWATTEARPGVNLLPELSKKMACQIAEQIRAQRRPGDFVIASIHWGGNWGYEIRQAQREFARQLIDAGSVDVVHGHSSHHPKGIEVYRGRLIIYGCGDFLTDYEGISGYEEFHSYLSLAYFVTLDARSGNLVRLEMVPFLSRRFRLERAPKEEAEWLWLMLNREGAGLGTGVDLTVNGSLTLRW